MNGQNTEENKKQATYWHKRLNWYLNEATTEEYDEEEVQAIMDLLKVLDPEGSEEDYYTPEKGFERFRQTLEIRMRIQDEFERLQAGEVSLADYPDDECPIEEGAEDACVDAARTDVVCSNADTAKPVEAAQPAKIAETEEAAEVAKPVRPLGAEVRDKKDVKKHRPKHFAKFVTAAALVVALCLGGTIGIYADRDGLFRKLNGGEDRNALVTSTAGIGSGSEGYKAFERLEDVPVKYLSCLWTPSDVPNNLEIYQVELTEDEITIKIKCKFIDEKEKQFIYTTKMSFKENVVVTDQLYDGFDFCCKEQYDSVEVEYLVKENKDYTEYIALFKYENSVYALSSNCEFDTIVNIIKKSISSKNL